ncbi:MAG: ureidoglycolate lyase [Rhizobiaceae bacterium]
MIAAVPIKVEPLTKAAFARFGDVIETNGAQLRLINGGSTERFHDLMNIDVLPQGGKPIVSIFRGQPFALPVSIEMVERHPLGSQGFIPMGKFPFLVVVAEDADGTPKAPRAFLATGGQGVNYGRNVWHHPLLSLDTVCDFIVIDRSGPGNNLQEHFYGGEGFTVVQS